MRHKYILLFAIVATFLMGSTAPAQAKVRVVATLTDLADLARNIGGDLVDVKSLATGVEDTHGVPMKPSFVPVMNRADLLLLVGLDCEHAFLPALI
ncbi:MAG: zinc ABC transporter substrate-binding protein, partial [Syntrophorhabdales bacterium]